MATLNQILYHYLTKLMEEVNGCIKSAMYLFEWSNIPINFLWTKWRSWVIDWIAFEKPWSQFWQTCVSAKNCELIKQSHPYPRWWNHALGQHMSSLTSLAVYQTVTQFKSGNVPNFHDFFYLQLLIWLWSTHYSVKLESYPYILNLWFATYLKILDFEHGYIWSPLQ